MKERNWSIQMIANLFDIFNFHMVRSTRWHKNSEINIFNTLIVCVCVWFFVVKHQTYLKNCLLFSFHLQSFWCVYPNPALVFIVAVDNIETVRAEILFSPIYFQWCVFSATFRLLYITVAIVWIISNGGPNWNPRYFLARNGNSLALKFQFNDGNILKLVC